MSAVPPSSTPEARAARRVGILAVVLMPLIEVVGVVLLALSGLTPVFVPAGVTLLLLAALAIDLGIVALRGSGRVAAPRNLAGAVAVAGLVATFVVGAVAPAQDDGGTAIASTIGATVLIVAAWALTFVIAQTIGRAERAGRR